MGPNLYILCGSLFGFAGVLARSLSSHALRPVLEQRHTLESFNLAADYLVLHGLALIAATILKHLHPDGRFHWACLAFTVGTLLFQGSVLLKCLVSIRPFGFLTPVGGFFLLAGWLLFAWAALCLTSSPR